jgi:hypothetical protein
MLVVPQGVRASTGTSDGEEPGYWSDWRNVTGWSLVGAGAGVLGLWIGSWVRVDEIQNDPDLELYRQLAGAGVDDVCVLAAASPDDPFAVRIVDLCDEGNAWATVWNVTLPLWVVLWGTGAGFLIWYGVDPSPDDDSATSGLQLAWSPYPLRSGGGIGLTGWF